MAAKRQMDYAQANCEQNKGLLWYLYRSLHSAVSLKVFLLFKGLRNFRRLPWNAEGGGKGSSVHLQRIDNIIISTTVETKMINNFNMIILSS